MSVILGRFLKVLGPVDFLLGRERLATGVGRIQLRDAWEFGEARTMGVVLGKSPDTLSRAEPLSYQQGVCDSSGNQCFPATE